ncbi:hypothetical protein ASPZODRAFT_77553 [Penicilliopsis zonata CBS 506.65]|uniref:Rhodopsin domain-containing protein n=1 Tax=Penicilliopsis zonata CBS 506.65 TaxID=1073090 RepID=A0A1L9S4V9_9EURO|nr:hypothetical protein ASPZODRAFT_77553 [Penicilliopsis zonata CBS 506.65]OJJ42185.1 hypothetical protein ASPZODRAFT_77553 [Penicilliopsis zonata CBS 506.65]
MSPFGDAPAGTDLTANRRLQDNAAVTATYIMAVLAIALRFYTRFRVQQAALAADDWTILVSLLGVTATFISTIIGGYYGLGRHVWSVPLADVEGLIHILFAYVLLYFIAVPLVKLSVLLFYRRIFGMRWTLWFCAGLTVGYWAGCTAAFLSCCRPLSYYWMQYSHPDSGKCIFELYPFYIGNAAASMATDVLILTVPMPIVWKLHMRRSQRLLVCSIFLLGSFVCVASVVRIYFMTFLATSADITWIMGNVFIWSSVEPCIGIVCACLPTLQPLLRHSLHSLVSRIHSSQNTPRRVNQIMPDWDEACLTTHAVQIKMGSAGSAAAPDGKITVETDFQLDELRRADSQIDSDD